MSKKMEKHILTEEQTEQMQELLDCASCGIDNLFVGTVESGGIALNPSYSEVDVDLQLCFTKADWEALQKTLTKAAKLLYKVRDNFDGSKRRR